METCGFGAMLLITGRHVNMKNGPGHPSMSTADDVCDADALTREDTCIRLRETA
jgi:hypothetical protein